MSNKNREQDEKIPAEPGKKEENKAGHDADPQETMKGPVSSVVRETGHAFETDETREDADRMHQKRW